MDVTKRQVEQIELGSPANLILTHDEAASLYDNLGYVLGKPKIEYFGCGDRYAHSAHTEHANEGTLRVCRGHAFDQT